jgi:hypothetical protein
VKINHIDDEDLEKLRHINKRLYGDGQALTPDERRDLANLMRVVLDQVETVDLPDPAEMLASLKEVTDWMREHTGPFQPNSPHEALVRAMAVIAEAEGKGADEDDGAHACR